MEVEAGSARPAAKSARIGWGRNGEPVETMNKATGVEVRSSGARSCQVVLRQSRRQEARCPALEVRLPRERACNFDGRVGGTGVTNAPRWPRTRPGAHSAKHSRNELEGLVAETPPDATVSPRVFIGMFSSQPGWRAEISRPPRSFETGR
ncbi:hypothetical protein MAPG_10501 [Magnaporthiopsis poae ATCC 64411]|uniref:Uncharacterized protein n=1 Tax=Magnaporthiopsis poae (strain ATCC 64411 / 73-15) TaxID=644358 RepID=A0A0C4ECR8_MAGP6|nr:hypothetical protein MAPG_10501 [Magnaporthiopsis poae ATCC 64411]